ncbi:amidohydrolase family protein [Colletotrichum truncatum]|uniref:Amidohydrolase family protein n=1 Tax=Colletotrichum truncatum TaxID=5467 RepID=A0ACC3YU26_COLTU|nr:amidohydrolase family protein [Colletotrichum truncatum]XP_036587689.1 amidohydrolase family protein [Colletotrichum truncatum]KAF6780678.1 amidohydrolase family protein [Colletotrichum truncatum]KAF6798631.1 amidohydrolase family protein [Colletotrichum truncatum]
MTASKYVVFQNGKFFRSNKAPPGQRSEANFAEALVIKDGVISFVGKADATEVQSAIDAGAEVRDVGGYTVLPGLVDGHIHLTQLGQTLEKLRLDDCKSLADIRKTIKEYAVANPDQARIFCSGWMHFMTPEGPLASLIDDLDPRPILITAKDLHSTWANSAALAELDLDNEPDPPGGEIVRDPKTGKPSGLLSEAASMKLIPLYMAKVSTPEDRISAVKTAIDDYSSAGFTGLVDMAMEEEGWSAIQDYRKREKEAGRRLPIRFAAYWMILPRDSDAENIKQVERAAELAREFNFETDPDCRLVGIKLVCDGIIDGCTASLKEPYSHNNDNCEPAWSPEQMGPVVEAATKHGLQVALHAIGDRTVANAIDVLEKYVGPEHRPRIEHLEVTTEEDAKRLGKLGITASVQPVHSDPAILRAWPKLIGEHRCGRAFAYSEFADGGAPVAIGSDAPTAPHHIINNLYIATTRKSAREPELETVVNPHFALSLCDVVAGATEGAARSCFLEDRVGSLDVGKKADLAVLDLEWEPSKALQAKVVETWFDGQQVFSARA